ncbi:MAG: hypothetical protein HY286_01890 [Planctomycetes bacterium]|nr:hypothetical protein [Planctomycetota bacterium]
MAIKGLLPAAAFVAFAGFVNSTFAQSNTIPGLNVKLGGLSSLTEMGRTGTFPAGMNGLAMTTTACNTGTVDVPWLAAMADNHPIIAFIVVRERGTRMQQISDRSYCKHGFFALSLNDCSPCQHPSPNGTWLGVGCSDTYSTSNNGDSYWLGPPDEIDPWLGMWNPVCSHFDQGEPPVPPPADCDGIRSLSQSQVNALGPVAHRIHVSDQDLNFNSSNYYYQGYYNIRSEAEANRGDNLGSKKFTPSWTGSAWSIVTNDSAITYGSVLSRWNGATVTSNTNGSDDGRVYVAVKVTGPTNGLYHYEYAIHNRDNMRGVCSIHLPVSPCTTVSGLGFHDVDSDATNGWTLTQTSTEIIIQNPTNPVLWNSIYNVWFDSIAAPVTSGFSATLDEANPGPGAPTITIPTTVPMNVPFSNFGLGTPGCNGAHNMCANSAPFIGNSNFTLKCDHGPANSLGLGIATDAFLPSGGDQFFLGITLYNDILGASQLYAFDVNTDMNGNGTALAAIPNDNSLIGQSFTIDTLYAWGGNPCNPSPNGLSSSNAMQIVITQ